MPSVGYDGMGTYTTATATNAPSDQPQVAINTGVPVDQAPPMPVSPVQSLASGIGGILLFPGRILVQQFIGPTGDPMDMSHLPVTVLLSAAAWYGAYWYLFERSSAPFKSRNSRPSALHKGGEE